ncbi:MAG: hypothetical protein OQK72_02810, partial [Gammaproteobacteria bacterium]|nr:hypothetical protein [Gammaproteobacteria bacterium]
MSKSKVIDRSITIKSKKSDIVREIARLKKHIETSSTIDELKIKKHIMALEKELSHRVSGIKKPVTI